MLADLGRHSANMFPMPAKSGGHVEHVGGGASATDLVSFFVEQLRMLKLCRGGAPNLVLGGGIDNVEHEGGASNSCFYPNVEHVESLRGGDLVF